MFYDDGTELITYDKKTDFEQYGVKYRSGRYPYGSGDNPYQHDGRRHFFGGNGKEFSTGEEFVKEIARLKKTGMKDRDLALYFGIPLKNFKTEQSVARDEVRRKEYAEVKALSDQGYSNTEIGRMMGKNESSIRTLLNNEKALTRMHQAEVTADHLKDFVDRKGMVDVGPGAEIAVGLNRNKFDEALYICQMDDYPIYSGRFTNPTNPNVKTTTTALCPPGTKHREIFEKDIHALNEELYSHDGGETFDKVQYPKSIDSNRVKVRYGDEGGAAKDGVIEIRQGVKDLGLDGSRYAQVRIAVDDTHYLKGMAVYGNDADFPPGVDIIFNTNKKSGTPMIAKNGEDTEVLKKMKTDNPDNPFGANIKTPSAGGQHYYEDENGNRQLSAINKVKAEGDWDKYSDNLAAQFLSKQPMKLINQQLDKTYENYISRFEEIQSLTNPTVRKNRLEEFATTCDGAAVHLQAAALPRQSWQVILPSTTLKDTEVYAPNYKNGETVALVRYPHGGIFEIPILTVNNGNKECNKNYGKQMRDAVAINGDVASVLSGADFDGDTVLVIPVGPKSNIKSRKPLEGLKNFDPKVEYGTREVSIGKGPDGKEQFEYYSLETGKKIHVMKNTQTEMGVISNLITDMTIAGGATDEEITRAVKHSMVVIDAEKHKLDYQKSYKDNNIPELKAKYQAHVDEDGKTRYGAGTLISRAKSEVQVNERVGAPRVNYDPKTGGPKQERTYTDARGNVRTDKVPEGTPLGGVYYVESGRKYLKVYDPAIKKWVGGYRDEKTGDVYYKTGQSKSETTGKLKNEYAKAPSTYRVKETVATQSSKKLAETHNAYTLSTGTPQEEAYAGYSNKMKALANTARILAMDTKDIPYDKQMALTYSKEVDSLKNKLNQVKAHKPLERLAQRKAGDEAAKAYADRPEMSSGEYKRLKQQRLEAARASLGGKKPTIDITEREWQAIQAGAVNKTTLKALLDATPSETIDKLALPKDNARLTTSQMNTMLSMYNSGRYTTAEIASRFGISKSTVYKLIEGGGK